MINSDVGSQAARGGGSEGNPGPGLSPRQMVLNRYWSYYRCENYSMRKTDWNGQPVADHLEHEVIATAGFIPAGFYDAGGAMLPIKYRRPTSPYFISKIIVNRFTGLLFGQSRHPQVVVEGDPETEAFLNAIVKAGRLWAQCHKARTFGGAQGSAAFSFQIVDGVPQFEPHDPRWCTPTFEDRFALKLSQLEKRYTYPEERRNHEGHWETVWFWYRRVITKTTDTLWPRVLVKPEHRTQEPDWDRADHTEIAHDLGVCPAVWIQNVSVDDDIDGDPDCHGIFDLIESIDALTSQAQRGVIANSDPTLHISTDEEVDSNLQKGNNNAIRTEKGGGLSYLEISGAGPRACIELAKELRERAFETTAYVADSVTQGALLTATEVMARVSRMHEQVDTLREQYGELGIKRLLDIALLACRKAVALDPVSNTIGQLKLPPHYEMNEYDEQVEVPYKLGAGGYLELKWPKHMLPTLEDITKASSAASSALQAGALDLRTVVMFLKEYYPIEDVDQLVASIEKAAKDKAEQANSMMGWPPQEDMGQDAEQPAQDAEQPVEEAPVEEAPVEEAAPAEAAPAASEEAAPAAPEEEAAPYTGILVKNARDIAVDVNTKVITASQGLAILRAFYPLMTDEQARAIIGPVGTDDAGAVGAVSDQSVVAEQGPPQGAPPKV